jgi:hypothetical protein
VRFDDGKGAPWHLSEIKFLKNGVSGNLPALNQIPKQFTQNPTLQAFSGLLPDWRSELGRNSVCS